MFTGIIEEVGTILCVKKGIHSSVLTIGAKKVLEDVHIGDSIAVSGVCLTVTSFSSSSFTADVMHETLLRSTLSETAKDTAVNLERAMPMNGRFGGHIVTGHIDGTGIISSVVKDDVATVYTISAPDDILRYIIRKGSVAIDGISLTVKEVRAKDFSVSVIPHTKAQTTLSSKTKHQKVNIENDCLGKYIEKFLSFPGEKSKITREFLLQHGY